VIRSNIPARIDRLPWSSFHTRLVMALGVAWILDGLEITMASGVTGVLTNKDTLAMTGFESTLTAGVYLIGQVVGALVFGRLSDKFGRKNLFMITLGVYLIGSGLTALTLGQGIGWIIFLYLTRFIAGAGIGGEYAAINSAIDELIPAKYRGRVDVTVNGTYWGGAIIGTIVLLVVYNAFLASSPSLAWRLGFLLGPILGVVIIYVRRNLPESPRWLIMNGRAQEAEENIAFIEREVEASGKKLEPIGDDRMLEINPSTRNGYWTTLKIVFSRYPQRAVLGFGLMITQSFLYNAIYFSYALVLKYFFNVPDASVAWYGLAFAVGNLLGPLLLGPLFDTVGRKKMIAGTYLISGVLLLISAFLFKAGDLTAFTQTAAWVIIFFFASAGASAGYLTVSEIFPLEIRAQAIAIFFSVAQVFGFFGTDLFGALIDTNNPQRGSLFIGFLIGALVMLLGGIIAAIFGINAEGKSLEDVADPLGVVKRVADKLADDYGSRPGSAGRAASD
jgi:MFS family permease